MNRFLLAGGVCAFMIALTSCMNRAGKAYQPVDPNPDYAVVVKTEAPNKTLGSVVVRGTRLVTLVSEINASHAMKGARSCPAAHTEFDVILHYSNGTADRSFTQLPCPGTLDQTDGLFLEPGIVENLDDWFTNTQADM